jgi:hypothetical protein
MKDKMDSACSTPVENEKCVRNLGETSDGRGQLGRPRRRWKNNIKIVLPETECEGVDWSQISGVGPLGFTVNTLMNFQNP